MTRRPPFVATWSLASALFLVACGGAPQPDEWIHVSMKEGSGSPYFPFVAVSVTGTLRIEGIDDGAGYAAGCFRLEGTETEEL